MKTKLLLVLTATLVFSSCKKDEKIDPMQIIAFADKNVEYICLQNFDANHDGILTIDEALAVTSLGNVFQNNDMIMKFGELVNFKGLTAIDEKAFSGCVNLHTITIPDNVVSIGNEAFRNCDLSSGITFIGAGVKEIGEWAFSGCKFDVFDVPFSVTAIGKGAFQGCKKLWGFKKGLPEGLTDIEDYTFADCVELAGVNIPQGVRKIGKSAFANTAHEGLRLPEKLEIIRDYAFSNCSQLVNISSSNPEPPMLGKGVFDGSPIKEVYVLESSIADYESVEGWSDFAGCYRPLINDPWDL